MTWTAAPARAADFDQQREVISKARAWAEYESKVADVACYQKFFTYHCLEKSHEALSAKQREFRKQELAIGDAERKQNVIEREAREAEQKRLDALEQPQRIADEKANRDAYLAKIVAHQESEAQRTANPPPAPAGISKAQQKQLEAAQKAGQGKVQERAANAANFAQKQKDAEVRKADVARRKAEAADKAAKRAAEKAAREAAAKAALEKKP